MESKCDKSEDLQVTKQEVDTASGEDCKLLVDTGGEDVVELKDRRSGKSANMSEEI